VEVEILEFGAPGSDVPKFGMRRTNSQIHSLWRKMSLNPRPIVLCAAVALPATIASASVYSDAAFDLFDNGVANLDILNVDVTNDATTLSITVETRGYETWTKYLFFFNTGAPNQSTGNGWNRPINYNGQTIDRFIGSWVDAPSDNSQFWSFDGNWNNDFTFSNDQSDIGNRRVTWTVSLAALGLSFGDSLLFDVGTSGGGKFDTTVDLLSRDTQATDWWTNPATSGEFRKYVVVPSPGALALMVIAGLAGARRRR